jgi:hypothetical protein
MAPGKKNAFWSITIDKISPLAAIGTEQQFFSGDYDVV